MKIIKRGSLPAERDHQACCDHCGTVFQFLQGEAKFHDDQRDGAYLAIACPVCQRTVTKGIK